MKEAIPNTTDVLVVGAGPTGMALAIMLQRAAVRHVVVDKLPKGLNTSRAGVIHAHTLEAMDQLGVSREIVARGLKIDRFCIRDRDRALMELDFSRLPSAYPYLLLLPQSETESILAKRYAELGGVIHRGVTATSVEQDHLGARVTIESAAGQAVVNARYVVGGDGMHSGVRAAAGIQFDGAAYEDSFVLADVRMDWMLEQDEVSLFFSPEGLVVIAPLPDGTFRVVATAAQAPEKPSLDDVQTLLNARGPTAGRCRVREVTWSSRFRIHHRLARSYRNGRLLVMGDAAHVHSPAGGQGMNTGLVGAIVLGQILSDVLHGERAESALDAYQELRRPAAAKVLSGLSRRAMAELPPAAGGGAAAKIQERIAS